MAPQGTPSKRRSGGPGAQRDATDKTRKQGRAGKAGKAEKAATSGKAAKAGQHAPGRAKSGAASKPKAKSEAAVMSGPGAANDLLENDPLENDMGAVLDAPEVALQPAELRDIDPPEVEELIALMHRFGDNVWSQLCDKWTMKVLVRADMTPHRRVVAVDRARLADLAPYEPIFIGIPIAYLSRKGASLTLEGARLVARHATRRTVRVNEKGTQLFLYGRHLLVQSIRRVTGHPVTGDVVLIVEDATGRCLGTGVAADPLEAMRGGRTTRPSSDAPDQGELAIHHQLDLGLYLRAQQELPE